MAKKCTENVSYMDNVSNQTKSEKKGVMSSRSSKPGPILTPY